MGKHYVPSQFAKLMKGISDDIKKYGIDDEVAAESAFEKFIGMQGDYDYVLPGHYDDLKDCWYFKVRN